MALAVRVELFYWRTVGDGLCRRVLGHMQTPICRQSAGSPHMMTMMMKLMLPYSSQPFLGDVASIGGISAQRQPRRAYMADQFAGQAFQLALRLSLIELHIWQSRPTQVPTPVLPAIEQTPEPAAAIRDLKRKLQGAEWANTKLQWRLQQARQQLQQHHPP